MSSRPLYRLTPMILYLLQLHPLYDVHYGTSNDWALFCASLRNIIFLTSANFIFEIVLLFYVSS